MTPLNVTWRLFLEIENLFDNLLSSGGILLPYKL